MNNVFPLECDEDHSILLHRDAHFAGSFEAMLDYYQEERKGVQQDFDIERISQLAEIEGNVGEDLSQVMLSEGELEAVKEVRQSYEKLRELYEDDGDSSKLPRLVADLILSEEEDPETEIQALVDQGAVTVPALVTLLRSEEFAQALSPGYGWGPILAARCLGRIGDPSAIIPLFESLGSEDFVLEEAALSALEMIGDKARDFLLQVLETETITRDNERAAMALVRFRDDPNVQETARTLLSSSPVGKDAFCAEYLRMILSAD